MLTRSPAISALPFVLPACPVTGEVAMVGSESGWVRSSLAAPERTIPDFFARQFAVTFDVLRDQITLIATRRAILTLQGSE